MQIYQQAFSIDQLQMFDPDQISVLTTEQMESLDPEKRVIVEQKSETTSDSDDDGSGMYHGYQPILLMSEWMLSNLFPIFQPIPF